MADRPFLVVENEFRAPPAFVMAWLTDVREDDRKRWFGTDKEPITILEKRPGYTRYTQPNDMGLATVEIVSDAPDRWHATMVVRKGEKVTMTGEVHESVRPVPGGTVHRAELRMTPPSLLMRLMLPMMRGKVRRELETAFGRMKPVLEEEAAAGKSPTA